MKALREFKSRAIQVVLTDIDGTLTENGRLPDHSYAALWKLSDTGLKVIPVTGRPAGWCELIARLWPVHGVVGENGALYFRHSGGKMRRFLARSKTESKSDRLKLRQIRKEVLENIPGAAVASDQFSRLTDLAIDFSEDVKPLKPAQISRIVDIFERHGATAKVSNIHVNGWFGDHDKLSTCRLYLKREFGFTEKQMKDHCIFVGDSPNDEPMFSFFPMSFAVANIKEFVPKLKHRPAFITEEAEAKGFAAIAKKLIALNSR